MRARRTVGCLLAAVAFMAACTSGGGNGGGGGTGPSVHNDPGKAAPDDPRTDAQWRADAAIAESGLLTIDDFPDDWVAGPQQEDEGYDELRDELADCLGIDRSLLESRNPRALSPSFGTRGNIQAAVSVAVTPSPDRMRRTIEIMRRDEAPGCYADTTATMLQDALEADGSSEATEVGAPVSRPLSLDELGDDSVAFRVIIPLTARGTSVDLLTDIVVVRVGRVGISAGYQSISSPFDPDEVVRLTQLMVDRLRAADAG